MPRSAHTARAPRDRVVDRARDGERLVSKRRGAINQLARRMGNGTNGSSCRVRMEVDLQHRAEPYSVFLAAPGPAKPRIHRRELRRCRRVGDFWDILVQLVPEFNAPATVTSVRHMLGCDRRVLTWRLEATTRWTKSEGNVYLNDLKDYKEMNEEFSAGSARASRSARRLRRPAEFPAIHSRDRLTLNNI